MTTTCQCPCGQQQIAVFGQPVMRFICHCEICQKVYAKPFADIVAVRASQVAKPLSPGIRFTKHRPPPAVKRGVCPACNNPVVALLPLLPGFGLAFVPAANFSPQHVLPDPSLHAFYHRRLADVADTLPKFSGYWASQWGIVSHFAGAWLPRAAAKQ